MGHRFEPCRGHPIIQQEAWYIRLFCLSITDLPHHLPHIFLWAIFPDISDYEKQKSYPTFANLDKIAEYFNATPTQLFGTSKEIELEKSVLESNEYSDKVSEILKAVKYIEHFLHTDGQYLEDLLYLTRGNQLYTEDGDELYIDPTSQKRTLHNQYEPGFIEARDKSPLELLIENKELLD